MKDILDTYKKMKRVEEATQELEKIYVEYPKIKQFFDLLDKVRQNKYCDMLIFNVLFSDETMDYFDDVFSSDKEKVKIAKYELATSLIYSILDDGSFRLMYVINENKNFTYMKAVLNEEWYNAVDRLLGCNKCNSAEFSTMTIKCVKDIFITFDMLIKMLQIALEMSEKGKSKDEIMEEYAKTFFPDELMHAKKPVVMTYDIENTDLKIHIYPHYGERFN